MEIEREYQEKIKERRNEDISEKVPSTSTQYSCLLCIDYVILWDAMLREMPTAVFKAKRIFSVLVKYTPSHVNYCFIWKYYQSIEFWILHSWGPTPRHFIYKVSDKRTHGVLFWHSNHRCKWINVRILWLLVSLNELFISGVITDVGGSITF
jgi:hypothetical protein